MCEKYGHRHPNIIHYRGTRRDQMGFINLECRFQRTNGAFGFSYVHNFDQNNNGTIHK